MAYVSERLQDGVVLLAQEQRRIVLHLATVNVVVYTNVLLHRATHTHTPRMELGHWVTGSMGHLSRPGHRAIILIDPV